MINLNHILIIFLWALFVIVQLPIIITMLLFYLHKLIIKVPIDKLSYEEKRSLINLELVLFSIVNFKELVIVNFFGYSFYACIVAYVLNVLFYKHI